MIFPRGDAGQIAGHSRNQGDLPAFLCRAQNYYPGAELVTEIVDQGAQLTAIERVDSLRQHRDSIHHDRLAGG